MRRAVIDIGTNTVKLFIADGMEPVFSKDITTRLGQGMEATGQLSRDAIARTVHAVAAYATEARESGATEVRALATSAARDAGNREELLSAVRTACGLEVEVLTGEREAELIFRAVSGDPVFASNRLLVMDIGGGSTEFILGQVGTIERWVSLPLGAVRLTEKFPGFAALAEYLRGTLHRELAGFRAGRMVATGGTNTTLAQMLKGKVDHARFTLDEVRALVTKLHALPPEERRRLPGLPAERADIIVAGGAVALFAMEVLDVYELTVSIRNLRYGALL